MDDDARMSHNVHNAGQFSYVVVTLAVHVRLSWLIITALGAPVVPLV